MSQTQTQARARVKKLTKGDLVGEKLGSRFGGFSGRDAEQKLRGRGYNLSNSAGVDMPLEKVEVKTRAIEAVSPQTVATMKADAIINTPYEKSLVCEKFQQQYRIKTQNDVVVENKIYDFSNPWVQRDIGETYEICRAKLQAGDRGDTISGSYWGYLEKKKGTKSSYSYRINPGAMKDLEAMATSPLSNIFKLE